MQQEVSGQDEKVKLAIIGKGKVVFWDYFFINYRLYPKYHNETCYEPVKVAKKSDFSTFFFFFFF